jgi:putative transposase
MYGCQQTLIHALPDVQAVIEYLCTESNKVWNCSVYYSRQIYFKTGKVIKRAEVCAEMVRSKNKHFGAMYVSSAQQTCNNVAEAFKSFQELTKLWKRGELQDKPSLPKYRQTGLFTVTYPKRWLKLTDNGIRIPLGNQVKAWFGIDAIYLLMPSNFRWEDIKELRILPRNKCFYAEFVYPVEDVKSQLDANKVLGIDHGIDNWLTCVSNVGTSFIIDGKHLKSLNQWFNKRVSRLKEN